MIGDPERPKEPNMDLNILVKDLPVRVNNLLNALAGIKNIRKHELIRLALIEYVEKHRNDLPRYAGARD